METLGNFFEFMCLMFGAVLREWFAWNHFFSHFLTQLNVSYPMMWSDCLCNVSNARALRLLSKFERCKGILEAWLGWRHSKGENFKQISGCICIRLTEKTVKTKSCSQCIKYSGCLEVWTFQKWHHITRTNLKKKAKITM